MPINIGAIPPSGSIVESGIITVTSAGVPHRFTASSIPCSVVLVSALLSNVEGPMVVGDSNVVAASGSQRGIIVVPGNAPVPVGAANLNLLWVDAMTDGDKLCFVAIG